MTNETTAFQETVLCEICGKNKVPRKAHFRCYSCGKFTCSDCAHYEAVFVKESVPLSIQVRSRRVCPNCKIKRVSRGPP